MQQASHPATLTKLAASYDAAPGVELAWLAATACHRCHSGAQHGDPRVDMASVSRTNFPAEVTMAVVDNAIYRDGVRSASPDSLAETFSQLRENPGMAWIGLYRPDEAELRAVESEFKIHELAIEDAVKAHQRPKFERYDDCAFAVFRPARYLDDVEQVEFGELHILMGRDFVVTVRHAEAPYLARVRTRLEADPELLSLGPEAVLYAVMDEVVDEYAPVIAGLENDLDEVEDQVFGLDPHATRRVYELSREVIEFQRATHPLVSMIDNLRRGFTKYGTDKELRSYLRDVLDHVERVVERAAAFRQALQDLLTVHAGLVAQRQNEDMRQMTETSLEQNEEVKRVSAWAAILFAPTLVGTIYGMNFESMPELRWAFGYPFALALMAVVSGSLYLVFKRRRWL